MEVAVGVLVVVGIVTFVLLGAGWVVGELNVGVAGRGVEVCVTAVEVAVRIFVVGIMLTCAVAVELFPGVIVAVINRVVEGVGLIPDTGVIVIIPVDVGRLSVTCTVIAGINVNPGMTVAVL